MKIKLDDDNDQNLASGKNKEYNNIDLKEEKKSKIIKISLTKDVLPFVIPLSCILTINDNQMDFLKMLENIKYNKELLDIFNEQSNIWWNNKDILNLIGIIVKKYIKKNTKPYNIAIQFKMSLQNLIDRPKELLELIDNCLKPKKIEKKKYGEVFTPMNLINEKLDKLDEYYLKINNKSIFEEIDFKWFDPANGMGNFPIAVYYRLMNGLKYSIPNKNKRKKHILENMLYMSEINKKNIFITKKIFNIKNKFKLNINEGDTLDLDIYKKWKIKKFDVIIGNPPYNQGGIRSHTGKHLGEKNKTVWPLFIKKSFEWLKKDGFLVFINPLSWLKKSHSVHNILLEKYIVWLKIWDNSQSKCMINADIPISLFILHNNINVSKKKTNINSVLRRRNLNTFEMEYLDKKYSIPLAYHSIFNKIINFIENNKLQIDYKTKTIKSDGIKISIPEDYNEKDMWAVDTFTLKNGIMVKKAKLKHPHMNNRKLIISNKSSFRGAFIDEGKLGLTGNHKFYILGDNLELILKILSYKVTQIISHFTKYGQDFLDNEAFTYIPDIRKLGIKNINEKKFNKLIGLTDDELSLIY